MISVKVIQPAIKCKVTLQNMVLKATAKLAGPYILNVSTDMLVIGEPINGTIDGSNNTFLTDNNYVSGTVSVYLNTARQTKGKDYNETASNQITFIFTPQPGDTIITDYIKQ